MFSRHALGNQKLPGANGSTQPPGECAGFNETRSGNSSIASLAPAPSAWPILLVGLLFVSHLVLHSSLMTAPRLWAEEMSVYLSQALMHPVTEQLFFLYERTGYFYLAANLTAVLAASVPLEHAAWVTTWLSALIVVLCLWKLVELHRVQVLDTSSLLVLTAGLLFGGFSSFEVWYNSINTQVFLGVLTLLILLLQMPTRNARGRMALLDAPLLLLSGLSGAYAALLWPLFLVAWLAFRNPQLLRSGLLLLACFVVQASIALETRSAGTMAQGKVAAAKLDNLGVVLELVSASVFPIGSLAPALAGIAILAMSAACVARLRVARLDERHVRLLLSLAALTAWVLLITVASHINPGGRYLFAPGFALLLAMVLATGLVAWSPVRWLLFCGLGAFAMAGLLRYPNEPMRNCAECPSWRDSVREARAPLKADAYSPPFQATWTCRDPQSGTASSCRDIAIDSRAQLCAILGEPFPPNTLHVDLRSDVAEVRIDRVKRVELTAWPHVRWRGWIPLKALLDCE